MVRKIPLQPDIACDVPIPGGSSPVGEPVSNLVLPEIPQLSEEQFEKRLEPWLCNWECHPDSQCERCCAWQNNRSAFPYQFIRNEDAAIISRFGIEPFGFEKLCNLWVTPDFLAESCEFFDRKHEGIPRVTIEYAIVVASELLFRLSGRQFNGPCVRKVYPGCCEDGRNEPQYWDLPHMRDKDYASNMYGCCSCPTDACCGGCDPSEILLPGPIGDVIEIVIDGEVLPRSAYKIRGHNRLIRVDGGCWPSYNDLTRSPYDSPCPVVVSSGSQGTPSDWVDCWIKDCGLKLCETPQDAYPMVSSHSWVNEFLLKNPSVLRLLPQDKTWVKEWLTAHGIRLAKCSDPEAPAVMTPGEALRYGAMPPNNCCQNPTGEVFPRCCATKVVGVVGPPSGNCSEAATESAAHWLINGPDETGPVSHTYEWKSDPAYTQALNSVASQAKGGCHSWCITYLYGKCPPVSAQLAAAELARLIARKICTEQCLPENVRRVTADGIDYRLADRNSSLFGLPSVFGNMIIDTWLFAVNPAGLQRNGSVHRADQRHRKIRSLR